ncbi:MAG: hypothetical protein LDLANPLL_01123 [Turneriella sp.]|nr:hypothetical protein [Turneriella sp.]
MKKAVLAVIAILLITAAFLFLKEYFLLKKIESVLKDASSGNTAQAQTKNQENLEENLSSIKKEIPLFVYGVKQNGNTISARVHFAKFKSTVERSPEILRSWGHLGWKVLEDIPALCIKNLGERTPFSPLGVRPGECIIEINGETINQPMRNLGIWLTLQNRKNLHIVTLRAGKRVEYFLRKG